MRSTLQETYQIMVGGEVKRVFHFQPVKVRIWLVLLVVVVAIVVII